MNHECEYCGEVIRGDDNDCKWCSTAEREDEMKGDGK